MAQQFWQNLVDVTIATFYYQYYAVHASRCRFWVSACCLISSSTFAFSWVYSQEHHMLFSILIFISQLISILQPLFPYSKQIHAAQYIFEDITQLRLDIEMKWMTIDTKTSEEELASSLNSFRRQYDQIENRFASAKTFPHKPHLHKKAQNDAKNYLRRYTQHE